MKSRLTDRTNSSQSAQPSLKNSRSFAKATGCLFSIALIYGAFSGFARAEIFSCKDEAGRVITSDRPIPECSKRDVRVLRTDGLSKGMIAAPLTEIQRKQREADLEVARAKANVDRERLSRDRALVAAFPTMAVLDEQRKRQLDEVQIEIDAAKKRILIKEPDLTAALAELEFYKGKKPPGNVTSKINLAASAILAEDELIRTKRQEISTIVAKFDADGRRLRELIDPVNGRLAQVTKH